MRLEDIVLTIFNALIGAGLGAFIILMLKKKYCIHYTSRIVKYLHSKKMILVFLIVCIFLSVYFNIAQLADLLLNSALIDRHPAAITGVGALVLFFLISLYKLLKRPSEKPII